MIAGAADLINNRAKEKAESIEIKSRNTEQKNGQKYIKGPLS